MPHLAFASVEITEILYDAPGSDSGHEWIEVTNTGGAVDLYGYKLAEGGTNHGITVVAGTTTLAAGESVVISNNPQNFLSDFPNYTGALFKSSFSLSNTGEEIILKDAKLAAAASATYSSGDGAGGDGNSLHASSGAWIAGAPNPGSAAMTAPVVKAPAAASKKSSASAKTKSPPKSSGVSAGAQTAAMAESGPFQNREAPADTTLWTSALGLGALIIVGVAGVLHARKSIPAGASETAPSAEEFDITTG